MSLPEIHYRYFTKNRALQFVENFEFYFAPVKNFNDPHDTPIELIRVKEYYTEKEIREILKNLLPSKIYGQEKKRYLKKRERDTFPQFMQETFIELKNKAHIFCLSREIYSAVLWSHYTNHTGLAIALKSFNPIGISPRDFTILNMLYEEKPQHIGLGPSIKHDLIKATSTKALEWSYERETRIVTHNHSGNIRIQPSDVGLILFGYKADDNFISQVYKSVKSKFISSGLNELPIFAKMMVKPGSFKLEYFEMNFKD